MYSSSRTVSLKCQVLVDRAKSQIAPPISYLELSYHIPTTAGSYLTPFYTFELIAIRRNR